MYRLIAALIIIVCIACGQNKPADAIALKHNNATIASPPELKVKDNSLVVDRNPARKDTLYKLLESTVNRDSFEYFNVTGHFIYLKTGYFLSSNTKSALLVYELNKKGTYGYEFYSFTNSKWILKNKEKLGYLTVFNFNLFFDDYNFDGLTDLFIQSSCSNGVAISRGHLLTQNPSGKLTYHPESTAYGNLTPDKTQRVVISDEFISCAPYDQYPSGSVCKLTNKWKNGRLVNINKECPCKGE